SLAAGVRLHSALSDRASRTCGTAARARASAIAPHSLLPLHQAFGNDFRGFGRRLAHVGVLCDLALDPLALIGQGIAQLLQLSDDLSISSTGPEMLWASELKLLTTPLLDSARIACGKSRRTSSRISPSISGSRSACSGGCRRCSFSCLPLNNIMMPPRSARATSHGSELRPANRAPWRRFLVRGEPKNECGAKGK